MTTNKKEILDMVDENDNVVGSASKVACHINFLAKCSEVSDAFAFGN